MGKIMKDDTEYTHVLRLSKKSGSKGVYFVLYKYERRFCEWDGKVLTSEDFVCRLNIDFDRSLAKAIKLVGRKRLLILDRSPFQKAKENNVIFINGKFRGNTVDEVYRIDPKYIYWIARDKTYFSDKIIKQCIEYAKEDDKTYLGIFEPSFNCDFSKCSNVIHEFKTEAKKYKQILKFNYEDKYYWLFLNARREITENFKGTICVKPFLVKKFNDECTYMCNEID